ncbi:MAG: magnesium transporter [Bacteroidota bacterium]|nr:magnesium transporter [Bacteroidota bacterium]MED5335761.1 magnesium transporter [Bacteroidota bacterium]
MEDITRDYLQALGEDIAERRDDELRARFEELHPADIAEVFDRLEDEQVQYLWKLIDIEERGDVLVELEEDVRETLLATLTNEEIAEEVLENIDSDDAADVVGELPEERAEKVIAQLDTEDREDLLTLLRHPEGTAGALMGTELIRVEMDWTVTQAIREMRRQAEEVGTVHSVYVVNSAGQLLGRLSLKRLLLEASSTRSTIGDLFREDDTRTVKVDDPDELVVQIMKKYDLVALPVVDDHNRLLGRITIDDVVDLMEEEAEKDYQLASGLSDEVESDDSLWEMTRARLPWLLIGLFGGLAGAYVIGAFDIERFPSMALFIPLIAAMGGNVGVQSAAIVVQGLAGGRTPSDARLAPRLLKELSVALLNGAICALVILGASLVLGYGWNLSVTVSLALIAVIVFAALFGTFVPLTLDRFKIDPALATGPFITTANDIIGLIIYFGIGVLMAA